MSAQRPRDGGAHAGLEVWPRGRVVQKMTGTPASLGIINQLWVKASKARVQKRCWELASSPAGPARRLGAEPLRCWGVRGPGGAGPWRGRGTRGPGGDGALEGRGSCVPACVRAWLGLTWNAPCATYFNRQLGAETRGPGAAFRRAPSPSELRRCPRKRRALPLPSRRLCASDLALGAKHQTSGAGGSRLPRRGDPRGRDGDRRRAACAASVSAGKWPVRVGLEPWAGVIVPGGFAVTRGARLSRRALTGPSCGWSFSRERLRALGREPQRPCPALAGAGTGRPR